MNLNFEKVSTIHERKLQNAFYETYGYRTDIRYALFYDDFSDDCYKEFNLCWAEKDEDTQEDALKVIKLLRDSGFTEERILVDLRW